MIDTTKYYKYDAKTMTVDDRNNKILQINL